MGGRFIKLLIEQLLKSYIIKSIKTGKPVNLPLKIKIPHGLGSSSVTVSITARYTMTSNKKKDTPPYTEVKFNWGDKPNAYSNDQITIRQQDGSTNAYYIPKEVAEYIRFLKNVINIVSVEIEKDWWDD
jgi:hypothetical protein